MKNKGKKKKKEKLPMAQTTCLASFEPILTHIGPFLLVVTLQLSPSCVLFRLQPVYMINIH